MNPRTYKKSFEAIGTHWFVEFAYDPSNTDAALVMQKVHERIAAFDQHYSRFRADSLVSRMALRAGAYRMPDDAKPMFMLYQDLYQLTGGAFTPLIGSALVEAGYDASYSFKPTQMHAVPTIEATFTFDAPTLTMHQPALIDIGAAGKGYLVDLVAGILLGNGALSLLIDAGGDILVRGTTESYIGLEHPSSVGDAIGVAHLDNQSICGSAGNRRAWGKFHHIVDPRTLESPKEIVATWVVAHTTMLADALATCLYLVPAKDLMPQYVFEYLLLYADYSIERSRNFPAEVFTNTPQISL